MTHKRNTIGIKENARKKAKNTEEKVEKVLRQMLKDGKPINFNVVARSAGVSLAWCYRNRAFKERITNLREKTAQTPRVLIPQNERITDASKDALIATFRQRISALNKEVSELRRQLEVVYGELAKHSKQPKIEINT